MIIVLILIAWTLILSLVVGLCAAARRGDRSPSIGATFALDVEALEQPAITVHANARAPRPSESGALARARSLAA